MYLPALNSCERKLCTVQGVAICDRLTAYSMPILVQEGITENIYTHKGYTPDCSHFCACKSYPDIMKTVAFGSCNKQVYSQGFWDNITRTSAPDMWLWTGDAYYTKNGTVESMQSAISALTADPHYQSFKRSVDSIEGVWDDHDFGINDAGKHAPQYEIRRDLFTQFISRDQQEEAEGPQTGKKAGRGIYYHKDVNMKTADGEYESLTRFIFLDTRSFRDNHFIPSLGATRIPFGALISAAVRVVQATANLDKNFTGDVLGEEQWGWLQGLLEDSPASFHVIISSIQVLTTNPAVESWGHFPTAKRRLMGVLESTRPKGVVMLSGDVHHAEVSSAKLCNSRAEREGEASAEENGRRDVREPQPNMFEELKNKYVTNFKWLTELFPEPFSKQFAENKGVEGDNDRGDGGDSTLEKADEAEDEKSHINPGGIDDSDDNDYCEDIYEITSSGLTHSCARGITSLACPIMLRTFTQHRSDVPGHYPAYYTGKNYGTLTLIPPDIPSGDTDADPGGFESSIERYPALNVSVISLESTGHVFSVKIPSVGGLIGTGNTGLDTELRATIHTADFIRLKEQTSSDALADIIILAFLALATNIFLLYLMLSNFRKLFLSSNKVPERKEKKD